MTSPKKGTGRIRPTKVTTTMSKGSISKAMIKLMHYQSLKVSNNLNNIQKIDQKKIMLPKKKSGHTATPASNECIDAVMRLPCESLNISNTSDMQMASKVEIMRLPVKRTDCGTATIGKNCTTDDMVVCGESFGTTTAAVDDKICKTLVHSIRSNFGPYVCKICDKYFKHVSSLKEHEKRHKSTENKTPADVVRPHVCDICELAFKKIYTLTVHYRMHTGHKPFACNVCGDTFTCSANRSVHMRTHTGYRPYICTFCGYAFNQSHVLTEHMRLHTGERPYECGLCNLAFVSSGLLRKHTIRKHNKHA